METGSVIWERRRGLTERIRRCGCLICGIGALLTALLALLMPTARQGLLEMCNRLFDLSEKRNSYVYARFDVPADASVVMAAVLLALCLVLLMGWVLLCRSSLPALAAAGLMAAGEAYLGVTLPGWANVCFFGLMGLQAAREPGRCLRFLLPGLLAVWLVVNAAAPGILQPVEDASEWVRDRLSVTLMEEQSPLEGEQDSLLPARYENDRDLRQASEAAALGEDYRLVTEGIRRVSRPAWVDVLRVVLLCLLIPVALVLPFLPFLWLNRQSKRAEAMWAWQEEESPNEAIRGCFRLVIGYLDACGVGQPRALYVDRLKDCGDVPPEYAALYEECALIWQEAAYSDHPMTQEHRARIEQLLDMTLKRYYDEQPLSMQLRLQYIHCLHG